MPMSSSVQSSVLSGVHLGAQRFPELHRVACLADDALRNLLITQHYHELSEGLCASLGRTDANWATFATWNSKSAGRFIRRDNPPNALRAMLRMEERLQRTRRPRGSRDRAQRVLRRMGQEVAAGNLAVFQELAPLFTALNAWLAALTRPDEAALVDFLEQLLPSDTRLGSQDGLARAFRSYYEAKFDADRSRCAERILYANILVALHEQTRLQPHIRAVLDTSIDEPFGAQGRGGVREAWRSLVTRTMMTLCIPGGGETTLGSDVLPLRLSRAFPPALAELQLTPLVALIQNYEEQSPAQHGGAAKDWGSLRDRMRYIVDLLRVSQQDETLFAPPFSADQRAELRAFSWPRGEL